MPACVLSHVRDETELTDFFLLLLLSGPVISRHILRLSLFFITILDVIYPRNRLRSTFFLGRDYTLTHSYIPT